MLFAPIAIFAYNRNLTDTVLTLTRNKESRYSDVFIFVDGGGEVETDWISPKWFKSLTIIRHKTNFGLANSVIYGVDYVLSRFDEVIVVEDDLLLSEYFLKFMNDGLETYKHDERVISIHGYTYLENDRNFFIRGADTWGWATWKRGWDLMDRNARRLLGQIKDRHHFDYYGGFAFTKMLDKNSRNEVDSWGIRWNASAYVNNKLSLYPKKSLVDNVGDSGTNVSGWNFKVDVSKEPIEITDIPVVENDRMRRMFGEILVIKKIAAIKHKLFGWLKW